MRESLILWWAFGFMTVKSRIWWAFLTGTATKYRKLSFLPDGRNSHSLTLVWSINGPFVHTAEMKAPFPGSKIVIFEFVSDADDLVTPKKSHEFPIRP